MTKDAKHAKILTVRFGESVRADGRKAIETRIGAESAARPRAVGTKPKPSE